MLHQKLMRAGAGVLLSVGCVLQAVAGISVGGTRVIYEEAKREASVSIRNMGSTPYVVQTWIDTGVAGAPVPLVVTPPLSRLDGGKENILRIVRGKGALPTDRESVLWLNVKEIPPKVAQENVLQFALRTRIKIFYRPAGMAEFKGGADEAPNALRWSVVAAPGGAALQVVNPSPYHVTLGELTVHGAREQAIDAADLVPPMGQVTFALDGMTAVAPVNVSYTTINDYGAYSSLRKINVPAGGAPAVVGK